MTVFMYPTLPGFAGLKTHAAWPVWKDSARAEVKFQPMAKKLALRCYHKARAWNRSTKIDGRYGGALGSAAMRVLESLIFDFLNYTNGRCDPSYEALARRTGLSRSTVAVALARLKELRIIHWVRRCIEHWSDGRYELRQETNAYAVLSPAQWFGFIDPEPPAPPPAPETWGATPPLPSIIEQANIARATGAQTTSLVSILEDDPSDDLAAALARLGRSIASRDANP